MVAILYANKMCIFLQILFTRGYLLQFHMRQNTAASPMNKNNTLSLSFNC